MTMTEQHATAPVPLRGLRLLRGDTDTDTAPDTDTDTRGDTVSATLPGTEVVPMTAQERAGVALRHRAGVVISAARELWLHPDRLIHSLWHGRPESAAGHFAYMQSRAWVPPEMTGRKAAFVTWAGFAYHVLIAWPLKCAAKLVDASASRPLRLLCLAVPVITVLFVTGIL